MLKIILFGFIAICFFVCLPLRIVVGSLLNTLKYSCVDSFYAFKYKFWNNAPVGFIHAYTGLFGYGKTLSAVHYVTSYFHKYNNKLVYDKFRKKFVRQYVNVLSNVKLSIPYTEFTSLSQIVDIANTVGKFNDENDCKLITIVLGDEFSTQLNSRNFKSNLDPLTLNSILTCRHHGISLIYTAQRFGHVDALLRQVTSKVYECHKIWRLQMHTIYDAWDLEQAGSSMNLKPLSRGGFFVLDSDYNAYDSLAVVSNLVKAWQNEELLSSAEILQTLGAYSTNIENAHTNRRYRKRIKK